MYFSHNIIGDNMIQITHRFEMRNGIPQVVIYCYTPLEYEFATDFNELKSNAIDTVNSIKEYVQKHFSNINNATAMIIINGVIIGSTALANLLTKLPSQNETE